MAQIKNNTKKSSYKHLSFKERQLIEFWHKDGKSNREIGKRLGRHHQTIANELKRGTTTQIKENKKVRQLYFADTGQAVYTKNRKRCGAKSKLISAFDFINYACKQIIEFNWSPDAIVGFVKSLEDFDKPTVSTKTLYNYIDSGILPIRNHHLKMKLRLSPKKKRSHQHKKELGKSIDLRPASIDSRQSFGHWEIDSVLGAKTKDDNALLTLVERKTRYMVTAILDDHTEESVCYALKQLEKQFGHLFPHVFKSITADNGSEFISLQDTLNHATDIYFAHPYSSWERGTNERHNGLLRRFIPKGTPIYKYSKQFIQQATDSINFLPRKLLNYRQPVILFLEELEKIKTKT
ncbi:IS30 family transposase [Vagococcus zengguangii]|uniref:IS30 family transposase n=1 Tax=Vagococcus zengguangii TaxID=2571750 RepID=A0A4D7CVN8_9ENTE|nr:IS30 family transposase [Vagococcus zengguangii]QCI87342.1 IS30 family transposase [Vagococcus zengguangii]TLG78315.1 IS30 family transposase [Vagococcus zengguangii]